MESFTKGPLCFGFNHIQCNRDLPKFGIWSKMFMNASQVTVYKGLINAMEYYHFCLSVFPLKHLAFAVSEMTSDVNIYKVTSSQKKSTKKLPDPGFLASIKIRSSCKCNLGHYVLKFVFHHTSPLMDEWWLANWKTEYRTLLVLEITKFRQMWTTTSSRSIINIEAC